MKLVRSKEWWLERAAREDGMVIGAGALPARPAATMETAGVEENRLADYFEIDLKRVEVERRLILDELYKAKSNG